MIQIEDYGSCIVASNIPKHIDPYFMLEFCDNVEYEGNGQFRFDGVYIETKRKFIKLLKKDK